MPYPSIESFFTCPVKYFARNTNGKAFSLTYVIFFRASCCFSLSLSRLRGNEIKKLFYLEDGGIRFFRNLGANQSAQHYVLEHSTTARLSSGNDPTGTAAYPRMLGSEIYSNY